MTSWDAVDRQQGQSENLATVTRYLQVVRKRKWTVILTAFLVVGLAAYYAFSQPKIYQAVTTVIIEPRAPQVLTGTKQVIQLGERGYFARKQYMKTQLEVLKSFQVAKRAIELLKLRDYPQQLKKRGLSPDRLEDAILSKVSVESVKDSNAVRIMVEDSDKRFAAELSLAIARAYEDHNVQRVGKKTGQVERWLQRRISRLNIQHERLETQLMTLEKRYQIDPDSLKEVDTKINEYTLAHAKAEDTALKNRAMVGQIKKWERAGNRFEVPLTDLISNLLVATLKTNKISLENKLMDLEQDYGPKHPKILKVRSRLKMLSRSLRSEITQIVRSYELQYRSSLFHERALHQKLKEAQLLRQKLRVITREMMRKTEALKDVREELKRLSRRYQDVKLNSKATTDLKLNNIYVLDRAKIPQKPIKPRANLIIAVGVLLGLIFGVGFAVVVDLVDNTVKGREDIERLLRLPFLGIIPAISQNKLKRIERPELLVHLEPKSTEAEFCRSIRTNLLFMTPEQPARALLVTSASPKEGKTTTSVNLGVTMAVSGNRTLILDTDMRRPRVHHIFGLDNDIGLSNYLIEDRDISEYIRPTEVPNLDVLSCGPIPPNPAELLHTRKFQELVEILKSRYVHLIFDSPPVTAVTDPVIIGSYMDGIVLVARFAKTTKESLFHAKRALMTSNTRIFGVILNGLDLDNKAYGDYHYYRSAAYGKYYGEPQEST